jgi:hypothetical protein
MAIMIEVEDELQPFAAAVRQALAQLRQALAETVATSGSLDYAQFEERAALAAAGVERAAHQVMLRSLNIDAPEVLIDGKLYRRVLSDVPASYYTMAGDVSVDRTLYRSREDDSAGTVDVVSLRAGVVGEGWLPRCAQAMAFEVQRGPSREAAQASRQGLRLPYSRSSFEDVAHLVGEQYAQHRATVERALIEEYEPPVEAASVSVSLDRVSVPMEEPRPRPLGRPRKDAPKNPIQRVFRMAYCATVTLHDRVGKALHTIRYGRMPDGDIEGLCVGLADDVDVLLQRRPELHLSLLCDGAPEMWNLLGMHLNEESFGRPVTLRVDFWHLEEKLGAAGRVLQREASELAALLRRWRLDLLRHSEAADRILEELRASGKEQVKVGDERPVHDAITYLENHRGSFDYASARRLGLPIGSGNVEATCKSLFDVRLKRSGCRWKETTGGHVVDLRALALGDRWEAAMAKALAPLRANVKRPPVRTRQRAAA